MEKSISQNELFAINQISLQSLYECVHNGLLEKDEQKLCEYLFRCKLNKISPEIEEIVFELFRIEPYDLIYNNGLQATAKVIRNFLALINGNLKCRTMEFQSYTTLFNSFYNEPSNK